MVPEARSFNCLNFRQILSDDYVLIVYDRSRRRHPSLLHLSTTYEMLVSRELKLLGYPWIVIEMVY